MGTEQKMKKIANMGEKNTKKYCNSSYLLTSLFTVAEP